MHPQRTRSPHFNAACPPFGGSREKSVRTTSKCERTLTGVGVAVIPAADCSRHGTHLVSLRGLSMKTTTLPDPAPGDRPESVELAPPALMPADTHH
jgi:hypothetical protein